MNRSVPASLATIIDRCLMKNPAHRYATADDLVAALDVAVHDLERASITPISRVTDTEAHAVWKRAAELQAMTGIQPRPEPVAWPRDQTKNRSGNMGVPDVRAAAVEAGIDDTYVEHALVEHGLLGGLQVTARDATELAPEKKSRRWWRRISLVAQHSSEVAGEVSHRDFDRLLNVLRDETGVLGHTTAKTRELGWWTGPFGTRLEVSIVPTDDRTSIHLAKSVRRSTLLAGIATFVTVGPASGLLVVASLLEMWGNSGEDFAIFFGFATAATASIWVTRRVARWLHKRAENRLRQLGDRLADKVRLCLPRTTK